MASSDRTIDLVDTTSASLPSESDPEPGSSRTLNILYAVVFAAGLAWTASLWAASPGVPVHDELGHVRIAAESWEHPSYLLDPWGRPANTLTYLIPSRWGLDGARAMSLVLAAATVLIATRIARRLGVRLLFLIPLLLWFQPWFNDLSYTALTEVPFSFVLVAAIALALADRPGWASLAFGLLPLFRHEGIVILGAWGALCLFRRLWRPLATAALPLLVYEIAFAIAHGSSAFAEVYLEPKETTFYGSGGLSHFFGPAWRGAGWTVLVLALLALPRLRTLGWRALALGPFAVYFATHAILYRFGLYASGGYGLFLLPLAPGIAIAGALGAEWIAGRSTFGSGVPGRTARVAATGVVLAMLGGAVWIGLGTDPRPLDREGVTMRRVAAWLDARNTAPESVYTTHAWLNTFYEVPFRPLLHDRSTATSPADMPAGSVLVWDRHYSERLGWHLAYLLDVRSGWVRSASFDDDLAIVFTKIRSGSG